MPRRPKQVRLGPPPDPRHKEAKAFYDSARWRRLRALVLAEQPLCECGQIATIVHHVLERSTHPELELSRTNLTGVCDACHTRIHKASKPWTR